VVQKEIKDGMKILEVGANIGYYALLEATRLTSGKVFAMEPDPRNQELLRNQAALNGCEDKIIIYPCAASDRNGTDLFYLGERTNLSSFVKQPEVAVSIEVQCMKLDNFPAINQIDFIRMDIQGYECKVLEGLRQSLATRTKPLQIFVELHNEAYNDGDMSFTRQMRHLLANGFRVKYLVSNEGFGLAFAEHGYQVRRSGVETHIVRDLYEDIAPDHAISFVEKEMVRSLLFASGGA